MGGVWLRTCKVQRSAPQLEQKTMSRVIVKNVPPKATEKTLSDMFSQCGQVTDAKLIRTRTGVSRGFGFVGLASDAEAKRAVETFHRSFIGASRIAVEVAKPYGDESLERPWSKYSKGSSAFAKRDREQKKKKRENGESLKKGETKRKETGKKKLQVLSDLQEIEEEVEFQEFLSAHKHKSQVKTWADGETERRKRGEKRKQSEEEEDPVLSEAKSHKRTQSRARLKRRERVGSSAGESDGGEEDEGESEGEEEEDEGEGEEEEEEGMEDSSGVVVVTGSSATDMDYLRSKVVNDMSSEGESEEEEEEGEISCDGNDDGSEESDDNCKSEREEVPVNQGGNKFSTTMFTLRMRGLPFRATKEDVEAFFHPLPVADIRFTVDKDGRPSGRAYVDFNSEEDKREAMERNGDCIGKRYIELFPDEGPQQSAKVVPTETDERRDFVGGDVEGDEETIADSGRLFLRNLSFTATEDDLTEAFEKFGPLTEVTIPLDKTSGRATGLGFITFVLPEHAVKAYESLDGQVFQGRLLHILPARPRHGRSTHGDDCDGDAPNSDHGGSFKQKRETQKKSQAGSSRNWNTLFLGQNAVLDAMAERYSTDKSHILDPESDRSVAVRTALGETQLVRETREFLESHGVKLEAFEQNKPKRSSTVILVKNLPNGTKQSELRDLFSPFGSLHRVILPPSGISSLVEFLEPSQARAAFKKLAYSKFKHLPLYLEWAPIGAVEKRPGGERKEKEAHESEGAKKGTIEAKKKEEEGEEMVTGEQCTLFVKNLNFSTDTDSLKAVFSKVGGVRKVEIARKRNMRDPSCPLSMGFGFVEFTSPQLAHQALKELQHTELDGHQLELKLSHRTVQTEEAGGRKPSKRGKQESAKIMVRNIPFEANQREVRELFQTFGQLKTVRLPKKMAAMGRHRGFGFVEFVTKEDAKHAFEALCHSTHLYGRRLVLEWAESGESVEEIRKRTAEHFHGLGGAAVSSKRRKAELLLYGNSRDND